MPVKTGTVLIVPPLERRYSEHREYKTHVFASDDGTEKRTDLVTQGDAQRILTVPLKAVTRQEQAFIQNLFTYSLENTISLPLWFSLSALTAAPAGAVLTCATAGMEFRDGDDLILVKEDLSDYEVAEISTVGSGSITLTGAPSGSWVSGDWVLPLIEAIPQKQADMVYRQSWSGNLQAEFLEVDSILDPEDPDFGSLDTYLTVDSVAVPVWDSAPAGRIKSTIQNPYELSGDPWQKIAAVVSELTERILSLEIIQETASERAAVRTFFDDRIGRLKGFWIRSRAIDFELAASASSGAGTVLLVDSGETEGLNNITRHVFSRDLGDYYELTSPTIVGDDVQVTVTPVLTGDLPSGAILENLYYVRFNHDRLTLASNGRNPGVTTARLTLRELQRETP